ncbi:hypothetical protein, variant 1 [Aphanomyces astaci]|nr:hypothetical protein, variant 1 [Aphanomyces astaci]ETV82803.1 hypothetical protein, variant 1 [Aphanomyces astaci]|eukprot:XP_009827475.1 hypothetical protein, variant 1 [Aphanomyces astaci]
MQIIHGCFVCLSEILDEATYDQSKRDTLFQFIHVTLATAASGNLSRLAIVKACLGLLGKHMHLFAANLVEADPYQFYLLMLHCCASSNKKIRKPAFACLDSMFAIIADGFAADIPKHKKQFNRFLKEFLTCLTDKLSDDKASIALAGLGNFAAIVPMFMGADALPKIHARLIKYGEDLVAIREGIKLKWMLLCRYTTCYGRFVQKMQCQSDIVVQNFSVELVCRLLDAYPSSAIYVKYQAELAIVSMADAFSSTDVMKRILQHGMVLTVSNRIDTPDGEMLYHPDTGLPESRLLFEYEGLWRGCLKRMQGEELQQAMVNAMADTMLTILQRLDLRYQLEADTAETSTSSQYTPTVARDHTIVLNATEFFERWVPTVTSQFQSWVALYVQWLLPSARQLPLVSAFYRLATVISHLLAANSAASRSPLLSDALASDYAAFVVQVSKAMPQYHDELLIATSVFVVATPVSMVDLAILVPALKQALALGVFHFDTAVAAVEALERWRSDTVVPFYPEVLPLLAPYLDEAANQSASFQISVLRLLGSLGGYSRFVVQEHHAARDDVDKMAAALTFPVALDRVHADMSIELLLRQMRDLAVTSIDRPVKAAAGEAYHAMVLYLCGMTATLPTAKTHASEKSVYFDHWHGIFPSLVQLAADADTITRSLFAPLLAQLLRWFSGIAALYPFEAHAFLDAIMHGLSCVDDGSGGVRDVAAQSVATFLKYASKQPPTSRANTVFSAHALMERLFALCGHPLLSCRVGAALAINHMYRDFREDDDLVRTYALSMAKNVLVALKPPDDPNAVLPLVHALAHMEKILVRRAADLQHDDDTRVVLGGTDCLNLNAFTTWLFSNVASSAPTFRSNCLRLFEQLARMVNMTGSCKAWLTQFQKNHSAAQLQYILAPPALTDISVRTTGVRHTDVVWYETLAASTESYVWACAPTLGNASLIADAVLLDPVVAKRTHDDEAVEGPHRLFVAIAEFVESGSREAPPSMARNRAFLGVCNLVALALEHPTVVPELHRHVMNVLTGTGDRWWDLVVLAAVDPKAATLFELSTPEAVDSWVRMCKASLEHQLPFRRVVAKHLESSTYDRTLLFNMESDLAQRLCMTYKQLDQIKYWDGESSSRRRDIACDFARLAIDKKASGLLTPMQDQLTHRAMETAMDMGWDVATFILQPTPANYTLFSAAFDKVFCDRDDVWLQVVRGLLSHVQTHPSFIHTLHHVLELTSSNNKNLSKRTELAPLVAPFAKFVLHATTEKEQPLLMSTLLLFVRSILDKSTLPLVDCTAGVNQLLCDPSTSVGVKVAALQLIPVLIQANATEFGPPLVDAVGHLVVHGFPVHSTDVARGSLDFESFELLFHTYLSMLVQSGHVGLLKTVFRSLNEKNQHVFSNDMYDMLTGFCDDLPGPRIPSVCLEVLPLVFSPSLTDHIRTTLLRQVFVPLMHRLDEAAIVAVYTSTFSGAPVVQYLMTVVTSDTSPSLAVVVTFGLLELLYTCLSGDAVRRLVNPIYAATAGAKGNELTMRLCKTASQKSASADRPVAIAAFRCLLSTVRTTQTQEKFYTQLLFADAIWPNIMAKTEDEGGGDEYSFETQTAAFPTKYLSRRQGGRSRTTHRGNSRLMDISTQFLQGSSLSQSAAPIEDTNDDEPMANDDEEDEDVLEMDALNSHPCMLPLLKTIKHMERLFQSQWTDAMMPGWMDKVWFNLSTNSSTSVRLFLCKVVLNRPMLFAPYAAKFVGPLVELMLLVPKRDEFHYLLRDVCHVVVDTWQVDTISDDLSRFVNHLMAVSPHPSTFILRDNLYLIEAFVTKFPTQCRFLNLDILLDMINADDAENASRHVAGMQLAAVLINLAFDASSPVLWFETSLRACSSRLETALLARLASTTHKTTPQLAADVSGLVLQHMPASTAFESGIDNCLQSFFQLDKPDRFLTCLKQLATHFPAIVSGSVLNRLASILPRILIQDTLSLHLLDIVHACHVDATTLFRVVRPHLPRLLSHHNPAVTLRLLDVLQKWWPHLTADMHQVLLDGDAAVTIAFESSEPCRMKVLDFLLATTKGGVPNVQRILLKALTDANADVRGKVASFWEAHLPSSCDDRLLALFGQLYHQETTDEWVRYAPTLWLSLSTSTPDNANMLFPTPLSSTCQFEPLEIDTAWARRTQSILTPLFSQDAIALQSQQPLDQPLERAGLVKATQDRVWSQTQSQQFQSSQGAATTGSIQTTSAGLAPRTVRFYKSTSNARISDESSRTKTFFQERASRSKRQELARLNQEKAKGTAVSLFRAYRVGEFPDIQIPRMDVLRPLLVVASLHAATSSALFSALLVAVLPTLPSSIQTQVFGYFETLLESAQHNTLVVAALHQAYIGLLCQSKSSVTLLSPDIIGTSSISSRNLVTGQRILEELLIHSTDENVSTHAWNQLHHVLQMVENEPYLLALATHESTVPETTLAVEAQLKGDLVAALQHYKDAEAKYASMDNANVTILERQRWKSEQFHCLATLNRWDTLLDDVHPDRLWDQHEPFLEKHTKCFLEASIAIQDTSLLREFIDPILQPTRQQDTKLQYLVTRFPDLIACANMQLLQWSHAQAAVDEFYATCLHQWSSMPASHRLRQLQRLPNMVFLDDVLDVIKTHGGGAMSPCVEKWKPIVPLVHQDSLDAWSTYHLIRNVGYESLVAATDESKYGGRSIAQDMASIRVHTMLSYAEAAVASNVLALAGRLLADYRTLCNQANLPKLTLHMVQVYSAQVSKLASRQLQAAINLTDDHKQRVLAQVANYYAALTRLFDNDEVLVFIPTLPATTQADIYGWQARALTEAAAFHREYGDASLGTTLERGAMEIFQYQTAKATTMTSMHVMYIEYLDKCLERSTAGTFGSLAKAMVETVLFGMALADKTCAAYFPRVLGLVRDHPADLLPILTSKMQPVPLWTCLHWSAQIMAMLDVHATPFNDWILSLLETMAKEYPKALYYDFRLSSASIPDMAANARFHRLAALLQDHTLNQFVAALEGLHHPEIRLKEALRYLSDVVDDKKPKAQLASIVSTTLSAVFDDRTRVLGNQVGAYNRQWMAQHRKHIEAMLGKDVTKAALQSARGWLSQTFQVMPGKYGIDRHWKAKLADFSDWLAQLDPVKMRIELPGQYTKHWGKPEPATHTYILSCEPQLMVLPSKQLPKRLVLHASDERTYMYLVKGGEDLRLDQRIEQLFGVMNGILHQHTTCSRRQLSTRTYNVVPMTTTIGLVEWLGNTTTLKTIVEEEWDDGTSSKKKTNLLQRPPGVQYEAFWAKQRGKTYGQKVATSATSAVVSSFVQAEAAVPCDLLRRRLVHMANTSDTFFQLRESFATSLAAFNGCSYVLGIGDRHLDNFLLDERTGAVVGIDFGISFGAGASLLPVPELVPFRYTKQLRGVLQPHDASLLLQQDLAAVLDALRGQQQRIDSVMRVFLNEPLLEWQTQSKTKSKAQQKETPDGDEAAAAATWMPQVKMDLARRKLRGEHVVHILCDELALNPNVAAVLKPLQATLPPPAAPKHSVLSPVDQAKALIHVATAPNVLGRMFHGWSPWA